MGQPAVLMSPLESRTLRRLLDNLELIVGRLDDPTAWRGVDAGGVYTRLEIGEHLVRTGPDPREYSVGIHLFDHIAPGEWHDHRFPFAVYPFGETVAAGTPLYEMPWQSGNLRGVMTVCAHRPYAIECPDVRHAVHGIRPHLSIVLNDVTDPPTRENRLTLTPLASEIIPTLLARVRCALRVGPPRA